MAQITEPPVVPNLSLPVPQRTDPENFSERMDCTLLEIPLTVDGINLSVRWTYDTAQLVKGFSQAAAQSVEDAAQQVKLAEDEVSLAKQEAVKAKASAQDSATSAAASEQSRAQAQALVALAGEPVLPEHTVAQAPLIASSDQTGLQFSERSLDYGLPSSYFGNGEEQAPLNKDLGDLSRVSRAEAGSLSLSRYDTASVLTTRVIDLSVAQVFALDVTDEPKTVVFENTPTSGRAMVFILTVMGGAGIIWPTSVVWLNGRAPALKQHNLFTFFLSEGVVYEVSRIIN